MKINKIHGILPPSAQLTPIAAEPVRNCSVLLWLSRQRPVFLIFFIKYGILFLKNLYKLYKSNRIVSRNECCVQLFMHIIVCLHRGQTNTIICLCKTQNMRGILSHRMTRIFDSVCLYVTDFLLSGWCLQVFFCPDSAHRLSSVRMMLTDCPLSGW